jgi:hypothetical protein
MDRSFTIAGLFSPGLGAECSGLREPRKHRAENREGA